MAHVLVWLNDSEWSSESQKQIIGSLSFLHARKDIKAAIGRGADGISTEVQILLFAGAMISTGFLQALGEDIYRNLKQSLVRIRKITPKIRFSFFRFLFRRHRNISNDIFIWFHFENRSFRVDFPICENEREFCDAIDSLPKFLDKTIASLREDGKLNAVYWDNGDWVSY